MRINERGGKKKKGWVWKKNLKFFLNTTPKKTSILKKGPGETPPNPRFFNQGTMIDQCNPLPQNFPPKKATIPFFCWKFKNYKKILLSETRGPHLIDWFGGKGHFPKRQSSPGNHPHNPHFKGGKRGQRFPQTPPVLTRVSTNPPRGQPPDRGPGPSKRGPQTPFLPGGIRPGGPVSLQICFGECPPRSNHLQLIFF